MRTPVDTFHQAMLNLIAQKQREERVKERARRQLAICYGGERVVLHPPTNTRERTLRGSHGTVVSAAQSIVEVRLDRPTQLYGSVQRWEHVTLHRAFVFTEDPPPIDNIDDIEKWLVS